jgi:hypothetical protein
MRLPPRRRTPREQTVQPGDAQGDDRAASQRNDFVRRREFDMLRKLRQREAAAHAFEATVTPSSFNINSSSEKSEGRALTLKKIDEIEEQMSQQWWKLPPVHVDDLLQPPPVHRAVAAVWRPSKPRVRRPAPAVRRRCSHPGSRTTARWKRR